MYAQKYPGSNLGGKFIYSTVVEFGQAFYNYAKHSHKRTNKK